ncbi:MAG: GNAT family N-acetyltransferase, partial [Clostridia bacterium]|nr:GNAT family N-acetyltransferase [Clostridia bacterium]
MQSEKEFPNGRFVFATENDFAQIKLLWQEAFHDDEEYIDGFLSENFNNRRIILFKNDKEILSMASLFFVEFMGEKAIYIFALATKNEYKGRGVATELLSYIQLNFDCRLLLQPEQNGVENFYKKIGFDELQADRLYSVCERFNITEMTLGKFDGFVRENKKYDFSKMNFKAIEAEDMAKIIPYCTLRPNKACESSPLSGYVYRHNFTPFYCIFEDACFMIYKVKGEIVGATLPFCRENQLAKYFKIQEKYFNEVLGIEHKILLANCEGFEALENSGAVDNYEYKVHPVYKDYLYSGESMRTLKGKKLSKKRNLIHQFERNFEGRWEYTNLTFEKKNEALKFIKEWYENRSDNDDKFLQSEHAGVVDVINSEEMYSHFKFGGIKIDGELKAISIGSLNAKDNMAIIDIEKADPHINGLYQIINREFLLHEFPDVDIVNREDDLGEENLRRAKMSYNPIGFETKYNMKQK